MVDPVEVRASLVLRAVPQSAGAARKFIADICNATFSILSRPSMAAPEIWVSQLQTCALACRLCAEECERHASMHEHCRLCAEACRECEQACNDVLSLTRH